MQKQWKKSEGIVQEKRHDNSDSPGIVWKSAEFVGISKGLKIKVAKKIGKLFLRDY
jgi:hypothetical protein